MDQTGLRDKMLFCSLSVYLKAALFSPGHNVRLLSVSESGSCALRQEYENMICIRLHCMITQVGMWDNICTSPVSAEKGFNNKIL